MTPSLQLRALLGASLCETASVKPCTLAQYDKHLARFLLFVKTSGVVVDWAKPGCLDQLLTQYLDHLYLTGATAPDGEKAIAATVFAVPGLERRQLQRANRALKGFRKLLPLRSRAPVPEELTCGVAVWLILRGHLELALYVLTLHFGYFRPGEGKGFKAEDLIPPAGSRQRSLNTASLVVAPQERLEVSKTQTFDDTVQMDYPKGLSPALLSLKKKRKAGEPLFDLSRVPVQALWKQATTALKMGKVVLYQLRHGGASGDYLEKRRGLSDIALRGRWFSMVSVRRYTKASRVQKVLLGIPEDVRKFTRWSHVNINKVLNGQLRGCPAPPA